jgi:hypothetical protein
MTRTEHFDHGGKTYEIRAVKTGDAWLVAVHGGASGRRWTAVYDGDANDSMALDLFIRVLKFQIMEGLVTAEEGD